jgi:predicted ferric reductase
VSLFFIAAQLFFCLWNCSFVSPYKELYKRVGWISMANMPLLFLLSVKSNPLGVLTGFSHDKLNIHHRVVGFVTIAEAWIHTWISIKSMYAQKYVYYLGNNDQSMGWISMAFWTIMLLSSISQFRERHYEWFYMLHVSSMILSIAFLYLHNYRCEGFSIAVTVLWAADRLIRLGRTVWFNRTYKQHKAQVQCFADGSVKLTVLRPGFKWQPGSHVFLGLPEVRQLESHPFTISNVYVDSMTPLVFAFDAFDAFTRDVAGASLHGKRDLIATIEGPYGHIDNLSSFDRVLFCAGGSGISYTLPLAMSLVHGLLGSEHADKGKISFLWASAKPVRFQQFEAELAILEQACHVELYNTGCRCSTPTGDAPQNSACCCVQRKASPAASKGELFEVSQEEKSGTVTLQSSSSSLDEQRQWLSNKIIRCRPDLHALLGSFVADAMPGERLAVVGCGPEDLAVALRAAVSAHIALGGPSLAYFEERFA